VLARAKDGTLKVCQLKLNEIKIGAGNMDRFFVGILVCTGRAASWLSSFFFFSPTPRGLMSANANAIAREWSDALYMCVKAYKPSVPLQHDITEAKRMLETVEQIFERGSTPMVMVCGRQRMFVHFFIIYWQSC
jgi:hypothetical protein